MSTVSLCFSCDNAILNRIFFFFLRVCCEPNGFEVFSCAIENVSSRALVSQEGILQKGFIIWLRELVYYLRSNAKLYIQAPAWKVFITFTGHKQLVIEDSIQKTKLVETLWSKFEWLGQILGVNINFVVCKRNVENLGCTKPPPNVE